MTDTRCAVCGHLVQVVSDREGTSHYEPVEAAPSGLREALFPKIAAHLKKVAKETGYTHPEYLSGHEYPPTEIPCLPEIIAEQVVEKYLMEFDAALQQPTGGEE